MYYCTLFYKLRINSIYKTWLNLCCCVVSLVVEEWVVVRRGWLVRGFLDALTMGGPGGAPRPIELQAHDPQRYVGDMLAWVHQALPSEHEAAQALFAKCSNIGELLCRV